MVTRTLIIAALLATAIAFQINIDGNANAPVEQTVGAIPWPFTTCGDGDWTIESLTLDQTPKRNINDNIVVVNFILIPDRNFQELHNFQAS